MHALPEDGNAAYWLQCLVALLYGYGRDRGEATVIKATVDHAAQIRTARSRQTEEAIAAGWLLNSTQMTTARSKQSAHAGCHGLIEPPNPGE